MENVKAINKRLKALFGPAKDSDTLPLFRLVWSEGLTEKRHGTFEKWYGKIFISEETGIKEVKKYSWIKDRWILEVYLGNQKMINDIKLGDGYEPVWVFNKDNKYQKPWWPAVEYLCRRWTENIVTKQNRTEAMDAKDYEENLERQVQEDLEVLEISTPLQTRFRHKEAIILPGVDF